MEVVEIWQGVGDGSFVFAFELQFNDAERVVVADVDMDGNLDLVVGMSPPSNSISVSYGDGAGMFAGSDSRSIGGSLSDITVADFNGDGLPELATSNGNSDTISLLVNFGNRNFSNAFSLSAGLMRLPNSHQCRWTSSF